jgi:hypothetical protein
MTFVSIKCRDSRFCWPSLTSENECCKHHWSLHEAGRKCEVKNMGKKKRAYCPYCDVFLVHNSLRSRRDHNDGWKHLASFQAYYARFMAQHFRSGSLIASEDIETPLRAASSMQEAAGPISVPNATVTAPSTFIRPPVFSGAPVKPPEGPSIIKPPIIAAPGGGLGSVGTPTMIMPPKLGSTNPVPSAAPQIRRGPPVIMQNTPKPS